jgi:ankyrin repeat protein
MLAVLVGTVLCIAARAQGPDPGGVGSVDPRTPTEMPSSSGEDRTTEDVLREMGITIAPAPEEGAPPSAKDWNGDPDGMLVLAIGNDDPEEAARMIEAGAAVDRRDPTTGMTPLMMAQSRAMAALLLQRGADPRATDQLGATPLHHALFAPEAEEIVPLLLKRGVDSNAVAVGDDRETPLLAARELFFEGRDAARAARIVRLLAAAGADVNAQDEIGYTMLTTASVNRKPAMAKLALDLGADPGLRTADGSTALGLARSLDYAEIERMLVEAGARE